MNCRAIGFHSCLERFWITLRLIILFARNDALLDQSAIPFQFNFTVFCLGDILGKICFSLFLQGHVFRNVGLRLAHIRFEGTRVDREQQIALPDVRTVSEVNLKNAAGDLRLDGNNFARDRLADRVDIIRHVLHYGFGNSDRRRRSLESLLCRFIRAARRKSGSQSRQA